MLAAVTICNFRVFQKEIEIVNRVERLLTRACNKLSFILLEDRDSQSYT